MPIKRRGELARKAKLYRRLAQEAIDVSTKMDFLERAERYEFALAAIAREQAATPKKVSR